MYIRRFFYDLGTGKAILSYMRQGDICVGSTAEDYEIYPELSGRFPENTGLFEWHEPDAELDSHFATATQVTVENGKLKFEPVIPPPTVEEQIQAAIDAYTLELIEGGLL